MVYYYNMYGWVKVAADELDNLQNFFSYFQTEAFQRPNLTLKVGEIDVDLGKYRRMGRFLLGERELIECRKFGRLKIKDLLSEAEMAVTKGYVRFMPVLNLFRDAAWFKLISMGKTLVHSACVELNGEGCLINAWLGMGKTMSTIKLAMRGFHFLGDDLVILDDKGSVYAFPLPLKLSLPHARVLHLSGWIKAKLMLGELIEKIPYVRRRIELVHFEKITDLIKACSVTEKAEIKKVFILQKASKNDLIPLDRQQVVKVLALQSKWERIFWTDRIFIPYSFTDDDFNLTFLEEKEMKIIEGAVRNTECFKVLFKRYASDELEKILLNS